MSRIKTHDPGSVFRSVKTEVESTEKLPVEITRAKLYARIDSDVEDAIVDGLILASLEAFEDYTGKLLFQREVTAEYNVRSHTGVLRLPWLPVVEVVSVEIDDNEIDYNLSGDYVVVHSPGRVKVRYVAGITESTVPAKIQTGCLKWITSNFDDREDVVVGTITGSMPNDSKSHWQSYKEIL